MPVLVWHCLQSMSEQFILQGWDNILILANRRLHTLYRAPNPSCFDILERQLKRLPYCLLFTARRVRAVSRGNRVTVDVMPAYTDLLSIHEPRKRVNIYRLESSKTRQANKCIEIDSLAGFLCKECHVVMKTESALDKRMFPSEGANGMSNCMTFLLVKAKLQHQPCRANRPPTSINPSI